MFIRICWIVTAVATTLGLLELLTALGEANGAPQEAAGAAIAVAFAVIPYVFSRSMEGALHRKETE